MNDPTIGAAHRFEHQRLVRFPHPLGDLPGQSFEKLVTVGWAPTSSRRGMSFSCPR
jgi:hypothetical protein